MTKARRHGAILRLLRTDSVFTQQELARRLAEGGVAVTQVTLSRDLHELGLVKTPEGYRQRDEPRGPSFDALAPNLLLEARSARNLVVVKTHPGHAMSLARALDQSGFEEIVGTIAGDDTILVVTATDAKARALAGRMARIGAA